ncbi:MAG TPA: hypothetical protein VFA43_00465 [Gemmatimonadaceae bacterium]|nr:hypothetical protein [Gemmatimonadaceae bacterium]
MGPDELRQQLADNLALAARTRMVEAMATAYKDTASRFDATIGSDAQWFGFSVWKCGVYRLSQTAADGSMGVRVEIANGQLRLAFGPFIMSPYSCGLMAPDDPWSHFPTNDKGAGFLSDVNTGQLSFALSGVETAAPIALVLGHYGNHDSGLEALYLKVPSDQRGGQICEWSYIEPLWRADSGMSPASADFPRPVPIGRPSLSLKHNLTSVRRDESA